MKRSFALRVIEHWARPEVLEDFYGNNYKQWAEGLLYTLETELGMLPPPLKCPLADGGEVRLYMWEANSETK